MLIARAIFLFHWIILLAGCLSTGDLKQNSITCPLELSIQSSNEQSEIHKLVIEKLRSKLKEKEKNLAFFDNPTNAYDILIEVNKAYLTKRPSSLSSNLVLVLNQKEETKLFRSNNMHDDFLSSRTKEDIFEEAIELLLVPLINALESTCRV